MAVQYDSKKNRIILPRGDTMTVDVSVDSGQFPDGSEAIFAVSKKDYAEVFSVHQIISGGKATLRIAHDKTALLDVGDYYWDVRLVSDPSYDSNGEVICDDDTDHVLSVYSPNLPEFRIAGVTKDV